MIKTNDGQSSWGAFALFYLVLLGIVSLLDNVNEVLALNYWGVQAGLITIGVGLLAVIAARFPNLTAAQSIPLAFTIGILTIIPAVLMGLGRNPNLWPQYFYVAFGMAAGSFLTFLFVKFSPKMIKQEKAEVERDNLE